MKTKIVNYDECYQYISRREPFILRFDFLQLRYKWAEFKAEIVIKS